MTCETFNSKLRNNINHKWLNNISCVAVDEGHLLGVEGRGDHLESSLLSFTNINKSAKLLVLSATLPNVSEIGNWLSKLNDKETNLLISDYRAVPLNFHYNKYITYNNYQANERSKLDKTIDILLKYKEDKFLVFVFSIETGLTLVKQLKARNINSEFHYADLDSKKRHDLENRFKKDKNFRILIATNSLAWGVNTPARRVIIVGVHRGIKEVSSFDLNQMAGRSGRVGYDTQGDVHILISDSKQERLLDPIPVESQILEDNLDFHLIAECYKGNIVDEETGYKWLSKTLAFQQTNKEFAKTRLKEVIEWLRKFGFLEKNSYLSTNLGKVSVVYYYKPRDVLSLYRNLSKIIKHNLYDKERWLAAALGCQYSNRRNIVTAREKNDLLDFEQAFNPILKSFLPEDIDKSFYMAYLKSTLAYYFLLKGNKYDLLYKLMREFSKDFSRLIEAIKMLDSLIGKWGKIDFWEDTNSKVLYGVPNELLDLCKVKGIGAKKARNLYDSGIKNRQELLQKTNLVGKIIGYKSIEKVIKLTKESFVIQSSQCPQ